MSPKMVETFIDGFHDKDAVQKMTYKKLGRTDMKVSRMGLGGGAMSGFYDEFDDSEAISTVIEAVKFGINYIDTAPYYGEGRSETVLGKALKDIPRKAYYLSTKVGRYTSDVKTMFDYSAETIVQKFDESLERLGIDYADIVVVHDVEFADMKQILKEALPAVKSLVKAGKARYIAISGYPLSVLEEVISKSDVSIDVVLSYSRDTLIDTTLQQYIPLFQERKIGIINAAPTAMSMLTSVGPQKWHPANQKIKDICAEAVAYCKERDVELGRLAVYHALQTREAENVLVGMNTREILKSNLSVLLDGLTDEEIQVLKHLRTKIFPQDENLHWEGVEIEMYKKMDS